ncbi:MAG: glycosyltransferase [Bacteroidota bacterium]
MENKKVLIIAYTFPPTPGIGGRRWAKFAKYFLRQGIDVKVLMALYSGKTISDWHQDITDLKKQGRIEAFKSAYPDILGTNPVTIFQKISYRAALLYVKLKLKGNYYDRSAHCKEALLAKVETYIKQGYNNIIVTVGPFMYAYFLLELKKQYPTVNFILDVRDPWTNNKTSFGYDHISPSRLAYEQQCEKEVVAGYDYITAVADDINAYFGVTYQKPEKRLITIKNGFDTEDFPVVTEHVFNNKFQLVFTGTLYNKAFKYVEMLADALQELKQKDIELYNNIECHFYGSVPEAFQSLATREPRLVFKGQIGLQEVYNVIGNASAAMLFLTDDLSYSFSTKFYEYLAMKKAVLVFSNGGKTGAFVEDNQIGYSLTPDNVVNQLQHIYRLHKNNQITISENFKTEAYQVDHLALQFSPLLK